MNTIGNIVKEKLQNYEEKLKASNRRSLSRICNCPSIHIANHIDCHGQ